MGTRTPALRIAASVRRGLTAAQRSFDPTVHRRRTAVWRLLVGAVMLCSSAALHGSVVGAGVKSSVSVTVVKDTTAPTVSMTAPANGATVSGTVALTASATDNIGVTIGYTGPTQLTTPKGTVVFFSGGTGTTPAAPGES